MKVAGQRRAEQRPAIQLGAVALVAVGFRAAYLLIARDAGFFPELFLDSRYYAALARAVAAGAAPDGSPALMSPLYPQFLALFTPGDGQLLVWSVRAVQLALGAGSSVLAAGIARRCAGGTAGWIAGIGCAVYGPLIHYETLVLPETLQGFCLVAAFLVLAVSLPDARTQRSRLALAFAGGILFGAAAALRPTALALLAVTIVYLVAGEWRKRSTLRPALMIVASVLAGSAAVVAPFTARNVAASGEWILLSANGGFNFWVGNHAGAAGTFDPPPGYDFEHDPVAIGVARQESGSRLSYAGASAWWAGRALDDILADPAAWAALFVRKIGMVAGPAEPAQLGDDFDWFSGRAWPLGVPLNAAMVLVPALFVPILAVASRGRIDRRALLASAWVASYVLIVALFFVAGRYRAPIVPVAFIAAAAAVSGTVTLARQAGAGRKALALGGGMALAILLLSFVTARRESRPEGASATGLIERQNGMRLYGQGKYPEAESWYRKSLAIREDPVTRGNLANALKAQGRIDEAEGEYRKSLASDPGAAATWYNLGNLYRDHRKDRDAAKECYRQAIARQPLFPNAYLTLALLESYGGDYRSALTVIDDGLRNIPAGEASIRDQLSALRERVASMATPAN